MISVTGINRKDITVTIEAATAISGTVSVSNMTFTITPYKTSETITVTDAKEVAIASIAALPRGTA